MKVRDITCALFLAGAAWTAGAEPGEPGGRDGHWSFDAPADFPDGLSIDHFVGAKLAERGLSMSPPADRLTWLRRVHLDLIGLPPTPEEVADFLRDADPGAFGRVVERLLASPRYGERWAQHWLDVVRYADTEGFEVNTPRPNAWPYRDYVIEAFNNDTPYDQFVREQLAGDQLGEDAATGFLVTAARLLPGQIGKDAASMRLARQDELGEVVINTSQAFLGLTVGCARCHDHKFDAISAEDYYAMQAFFAGVSYGERRIRSAGDGGGELERLEERRRQVEGALASLVPLANSGVGRPPVDARLNIERLAPTRARRVRFTIHETNKYEPCIDELEVFDSSGNNVALATAGATWTASGSNVEPDRHQPEFINDGEYGNSRSWMCSSGTGWITIEFAEEVTVERVVWGRDRQGKFTDRLATRYLIEGGGDVGGWRSVASSGDRRELGSPVAGGTAGLDPAGAGEKKRLLEEKKELDARIASLRAEGMVFGGTFGEPQPTFLLSRGDPEQPGREVAPAVLGALGGGALPGDAPEGRRRMALAEWIASPDNPFTARVMVNRIWQGHFGVGLVETSNDFGRAGAEPSHPGLLDWLAAEFVRSGWSVKHMHRLITLSATFRQSSYVDPAAHSKDAEVRLLWRFPSRRLEAEGLRDSILAVSGRLNPKAGGPGFDLFQSRGGLSGFPPVESFDDEGRRRMIYAHKIRMEPDAVFGAFDCPDAGQGVARRRQSTTPIQALNLFNSRFTADESEAFAARVGREAAADVASQVRRAYQLAYGRAPAADELAAAGPVVREHGLATLCRAIFNSSEFVFIP